MSSPLPFAWFLMHPFTVLVLTLTVCFLSPFLDSLPQLFLKCLLPTFVFVLSASLRLSFVHLCFTSGYSAFCFFLSALLDSTSQRFYRCILSILTSRISPLPDAWSLMHPFTVLLLGSTDGFFSFFPDSLPQLFLRWSPFEFLLWGRYLAFCFLSSASALASHYLASVSSVPSSSWFCLTVTSSVLIFSFHLRCLLRYLLPDFSCSSLRFRYLASCLFSFALSCFAPTAVLQVIPLCFRFRDFLLPVDFLSFLFFSLLATQLSVSSVPFLPGFTSQQFSQCTIQLPSWRLHLSFIPDLSCPSSRFLYLAFCLFPFALPWLTPTAVDQVIPLDFSFRADSWRPLSFVRFRFRTSLLSFCFFRSVSSWLHLTVTSPVLISSFQIRCLPPYLPSGFPYFFSGFSYLVFCLFPFVLPGFAPTAVSPVLPSVHFLASVSLSGSSADFRLSFVHLGPLQTTQLSDLSFPFFSMSPASGYLDACFIIRTACCHAFLQILVLSILRFLLPITVSHHSATSVSQLFLAEVSWFLLGLRFRRGDLASGIHLIQMYPGCVSWGFPSSYVILSSQKHNVNNFFTNFYSFLYFLYLKRLHFD